MFDFEPVLRRVLDEIRGRVSARLKDELGIDALGYKNESA